MKINKNSLQARVINISKEKGVDPNIIYSKFFFDSFLLRLSNSKYSSNFVLKGGLYLSSILGIESRSTMDIDFAFYKMKLEQEKIINIVQEICNQQVDDNLIFEYLECSEIKKDDEYCGFSLKIRGKLENIIKIFDIDIATGDEIYPNTIDCNYECLVTKESLSLKVYPIESIISEKMQTFLSRGIYNSRTKDLYDLYILEKFYMPNLESLKVSFAKTCFARNFKISKEDSFKMFYLIKSDSSQQIRWKAFSSKTKYAKNICYDDIFKSIENLLNLIF